MQSRIKAAEGLSRPGAVALGSAELDLRARFQPALYRAGALALGFAGGWAVLYGQLSPLGLGLVLGAGEPGFAAAAAGAVLALLLRGSGLHGVCLVCGIGAAVAVRWVLPQRFGPAAGLGCGVLVGSGICFGLGAGGGFGLALTCGADALLGAALGWALRRWPVQRPGPGRLLAAGVVFCALGPAAWGGLRPGLTLGVLAGLVLCSRGQSTEALALSGVAGSGLYITDPTMAPAAAALGLGGAAAALLAPARRVEGLAAYGAGCALVLVGMSPPGTAFAWMVSAGAGLAIYWLLPRAWTAPPPAQEPPDLPERPRLSAAATRLEAVAESLSSLAETVNQVYEGLPRRCESFRWVIDNTHDTLCAHCGRCAECWQQEHAAVLEGMEALRPILEQQGGVEPGALPAQLGRCIHPAALCAAVSRSFALYRSRQEARVHAEAMRTALTEQYSAVAEALGVLSEQLGRPGSPEPYKSGRVADFFASMGVQPLECAVTLDELGRTRAAVTLPRTRFSQAELAALSREVGQICRRRLDIPQVLSCRGITTLLFCETPALRAVFGTAGVAARGEVSGDAVQQFCSPAAAQMILCDGMGTGRPAAVDGSLAAELTARLLKAGFTAELAARLVNVALALKSEEESGATLDLLSIDLYTGAARLFKAGAAPSFLVQGGRARAVGQGGLPVGILGAVNGQSILAHLAAGDYAVLVSDGLLADGTGWVLQQLELSAASRQEPEQLARTLVETARSRTSRTGRPDDITAAVVRLENG